MLYKRRKSYFGTPSGFYRFQSGSKTVFGSSDGDFIRLRDEHGKEWRGVAEKQQDDTIRFRFRDPDGNYASGISDGHDIILRDAKGRSWRGFID